MTDQFAFPAWEGSPEWTGAPAVFASGAIIARNHSPNVGGFQHLYFLLYNVDALFQGVWVDTSKYRTLNIELPLGTSFVGTIEIMGTNSYWSPANSLDGVTLGSLTTAGNIATTAPWRWVKAKVSAYTSGSALLNMQAVGP